MCGSVCQRPGVLSQRLSPRPRLAPAHIAVNTIAPPPLPLLLSPQKPAPEDAWAPVLLHAPHSSETLALGAALLRMGAAEAVHPLFLAGGGGTMQHLADAVSLQASAGHFLYWMAGWRRGLSGCMPARLCRGRRRATASQHPPGTPHLSCPLPPVAVTDADGGAAGG